MPSRLKGMLARSLATYVSVVVLVSLAAACRTYKPGNTSALQNTAPVSQQSLPFYEAIRTIGEQPQAAWQNFVPATGIVVTKRNAKGEATEGQITALIDTPTANTKVVVIGAFNDWGKSATAEDELQKVPGQASYMRGRLRQLSHLMEYRLLVNGTSLLDPSAYLYSTPELNEKLGRSTNPAYLNSVFWDHEHPGAYRRQSPVVDLREKAVVVGESEVYELAAKWPRQGGVGPDHRYNTYRFIATSGLIAEMKKIGYNAVEFLPFNQSVDGDRWHFRYQVYGLFAPESKYGTPDEFAMMIDAFNKAGIAVIMDAVVGHYPYQANQNERSLQAVGIHQFKKEDGKAVFGQEGSPWGTYRYDYANPFVRRFLTDSLLFMLQRYGISGIRFDNLDGIRLYNGPGGGGPEFLKMMAAEIRRYQPSTLMIAEMFFGFNPVLQARADGGYGINYRTHSDLFDFFKDNMLQRTEGINMDNLRQAVRRPWEWGEAARCQYITNHDEAANRRNGATGAYVASLLKGGDWYYVEKKTIAFASLAMLSGAVFLDMPQMRLLQEGSFTDNPAVDWGLRSLASQGAVYRYFADLSHLFAENEAFAFKNFHPNVENHTDEGNKVISLRRINQATGKSIYALINLSHQELRPYAFGVESSGQLGIVMDSSRKIYGGKDELAGTSELSTSDQGRHGKSRSVTVPVLPPYGVLVLEEK